MTRPFIDYKFGQAVRDYANRPGYSVGIISRVRRRFGEVCHLPFWRREAYRLATAESIH